MTIRELIIELLSRTNIDETVTVTILRRDEYNCVTHKASLPIERVGLYSKICVEEASIKWEKYV